MGEERCDEKKYGLCCFVAKIPIFALTLVDTNNELYIFYEREDIMDIKEKKPRFTTRLFNDTFKQINQP